MKDDNYSQIIQQILLQKYQRQKKLSDLFQDLENEEINITGEKIGRMFGTTYLVTKRMITLVIGLILSLLALILLIQPDIVFNDKVVDEIIAEANEEDLQLREDQIEDAWKIVYSDRLNRRAFSRLILDIIQSTYREDFLFTIHILGYLLLILGLITLYISRLTRKMWKRNNRISKAQRLTQDLIEEFKIYIKEDEGELATLENLVMDNPDTEDQV